MARDHPRIFFDTNRILPSTPRRFFGSLEESKGTRIKITPTVRDQLIRVLPTLEMNHYQKTIRNIQHKTKKSEIIKKTGKVSEEWITGELDSANSAESIFECIDPNHEHRFDIVNIENISIYVSLWSKARGDTAMAVADRQRRGRNAQPLRSG